MKLYKFRPLGSCQDLVRAQEILETGKFWCSRFWELNDPMEGVYWFNAGTLTESFIRKLYDAKTKHTFCSFSGLKAFEHPLMWGYYANGFKGVAIEIEVDSTDVKKVTYSSDVANIMREDDAAGAARRILTTKLCCWSHEDEYRYIIEDNDGPHQIGCITAVCFGNPYKTAVNADAARQRDRVRKYLCRVDSLKQTVKKGRHIKGKDIVCRQVDVVGGRVVPLPGGDEA